MVEWTLVPTELTTGINTSILMHCGCTGNVSIHVWCPVSPVSLPPSCTTVGCSPESRSSQWRIGSTRSGVEPQVRSSEGHLTTRVLMIHGQLMCHCQWWCETPANLLQNISGAVQHLQCQRHELLPSYCYTHHPEEGAHTHTRLSINFKWEGLNDDQWACYCCVFQDRFVVGAGLYDSELQSQAERVCVAIETQLDFSSAYKNTSSVAFRTWI